MGFCNGNDAPGYMNLGGGGFGQGRRGGGRGRGRGRPWGASGGAATDAPLDRGVREGTDPKHDGNDGLRARVEELGRMMDDLRRRLDEGDE
jgi:hypothetical protein